MGITFKAKCSACGEEFECQPGELNSTCYLGRAGKNFYLPKCPSCGNWRDNKLVDLDGTLTKALR